MDLDWSLQNKRGTSAHWSTSNPTLKEGQFGIETDTNRLKIGTGANWIDTPYFSPGSADVAELISGGVITVGSFGGSGTNNDIRISPVVWYVPTFGTFSTAPLSTDFLDITLSSAGTQRYIGIYGLSTGFLSKVEGDEAALATFPTAPADSALVGYILVTDGAVSSTPDLSGYLLKADKASAASVLAGTDDDTYITPKGLADSGVLGTDTMKFMGTVDCSTNPDYPAGTVGDFYAVDVAGKIGGASGIDVVHDDIFICITDSPVPGNQSDVGANFFVIHSGVRVPEKVIQLACSDETTALTTGTKIVFRMPYALTLTGVRASLTTAQSSGSILTVNIKESGTTIFSTKLTIDNAAKTSVGATTPAVISDSALADDAEITIDIDQIGDGTAMGLKITLIGT